MDTVSAVDCRATDIQGLIEFFLNITKNNAAVLRQYFTIKPIISEINIFLKFVTVVSIT